MLDARLFDLRAHDIISDRPARHPYQDRAAAGPQRLEDACNGPLAAAALEDDVRAPAVRQVVDDGGHTLRGDIDRRDRSQFCAQIKLRLLRVGQEDPAAPARQRGQGGYHADRPRAQDHGQIARLDPGLLRGLHPHRQRLDHGGLGERDVIGDLERVIGGVDDRGPQNAVDRRRSPEPDSRVQVI